MEDSVGCAGLPLLETALRNELVGAEFVVPPDEDDAPRRSKRHAPDVLVNDSINLHQLGCPSYPRRWDFECLSALPHLDLLSLLYFCLF